MAFKDKYTTSIHGRRLGLQAMSSGETGSGNGRHDFIVGAEDVRVEHSTAETTSQNLKPFGVSVLTTSVSSGVYTMDPPIPGVKKTLVFGTTSTNAIYLKLGSATITSTQGRGGSVIASSQGNYAVVTLVPVSTGEWAVMSPMSSGYLRATGTT